MEGVDDMFFSSENGGGGWVNSLVVSNILGFETIWTSNPSSFMWQKMMVIHFLVILSVVVTLDGNQKSEKKNSPVDW